MGFIIGNIYFLSHKYNTYNTKYAISHIFRTSQFIIKIKAIHVLIKNPRLRGDEKLPVRPGMTMRD